MFFFNNMIKYTWIEVIIMKDSSFNSFYETYIYSLKEQLESIIHAKNDVEIKQYMQKFLL